MFKETEGMLWRPGESDPDSLRATSVQPATASTPQTSPAPAPLPPPASFAVPAEPALDTVAPPPAIAESGFALGDTEMRRAIRWVQWLQAQGARALGDAPERARPSGSLDALFNSPASAPYPALGDQTQTSAPPITALPSAPSGALPSGPLPPPSSADLRQMFAELDPGVREREVVVDADLVPPDAPQEAAAPTANAPGEWPAALADALNWPDDGAGYETGQAGDALAARGEAWAGSPVAPPDATIEELDRLGMADGFTPFTLEPGALASVAGESGTAREAEREGDWLDTRAPEAPQAFMAPAEPEPSQAPAPEPPVAPSLASQTAVPDPHDYATRLAQARGHRESGALDEAIVEYRTVVRNAPELLPDVLSDVESCLAERPEHPELHRLLGDARIRQGDYLGALESYNRAVALTQSLDG